MTRRDLERGGPTGVQGLPCAANDPARCSPWQDSGVAPRPGEAVAQRVSTGVRRREVAPHRVGRDLPQLPEAWRHRVGKREHGKQWSPAEERGARARRPRPVHEVVRRLAREHLLQRKLERLASPAVVAGRVRSLQIDAEPVDEVVEPALVTEEEAVRPPVERRSQAVLEEVPLARVQVGERLARGSCRGCSRTDRS